MYPLLSLAAFVRSLLPLCPNQVPANATVSSPDYQILGLASPFVCRRGLYCVQGRTNPSLCSTSSPLPSSHDAMLSTSFLRLVFPAWRVKLTNEVHDFHLLASSLLFLTQIAPKLRHMSFTHYSKTRRTKSNFTVGVPREDLENPALGLGTHSSCTPAPRGVIRPLIYIIALGELTVSFYFVSQTTVTTIFFLPPIGSHSACMSTPCFFPPQPGCIENQFVTVVSGNEVALGTLLYCWSYLSPAWFVSTTYLHYWTDSRWLSIGVAGVTL